MTRIEAYPVGIVFDRFQVRPDRKPVFTTELVEEAQVAAKDLGPDVPFSELNGYFPSDELPPGVGSWLEFLRSQPRDTRTQIVAAVNRAVTRGKVLTVGEFRTRPDDELGDLGPTQRQFLRAVIGRTPTDQTPLQEELKI